MVVYFLNVFMVLTQSSETDNSSCDAFANENSVTNQKQPTKLKSSTVMKTKK